MFKNSASKLRGAALGLFAASVIFAAGLFITSITKGKTTRDADVLSALLVPIMIVIGSFIFSLCLYALGDVVENTEESAKANAATFELLRTEYIERHTGSGKSDVDPAVIAEEIERSFNKEDCRETQ